MILTKREVATLELFGREGECNEGMMADELYPLVLRPRLVANSLQRKGYVKFGTWWDEEAGYELLLTDAGQRAVDALALPRKDPDA